MIAVPQQMQQDQLPVISGDDSIEFAMLPGDIQADVNAWLDALKPALTGPRRGRGAAIRHAAQQMGVSTPCARRHYDRFREIGWRGLVNWAKAGKPCSGVPVDTVRWIKGHVENYGGNFRRAYEAIIAWWRAGNPIPGYSEWPEPGVHGYPHSWSYHNLNRLARLTKAEKKLSRIGRSAAQSCMPLVITTRRDLHCGQIYMFDDVWHDVHTHFIGVNKEPVRPLELACMDVFSAAKVAWGLKPRIRDEATGKRINLRETDMRFLLAYVLTQHGYWPEGCQLVVEHGTAAIGSDLEKILHDESNGIIRVNRSGIQDKPAILGAWAGEKHGNFRLKAALESHHNFMHNVGRYLPGQSGSSSRVDKPEELAGRTREHEQLVKAIGQAIIGQSPDRIAWLLENIRSPFIPFYTYGRLVDMLYRIIDARTNHDLEGWEEAGLMSGQYRLSTTDATWLDDATLLPIEPEKRMAIEAIVAANHGLHQFRKLSPAEVWSQRMTKRLGEHLIPRIIGQALAVERKVTPRGTIELEDRETGPGKFVFVARATNAYGHTVLLRDGETYSTILNPFDSNKLFICDARFRYIGVCSRQIAVSRADTEAIVRAQGQAAHNEVIRLQEYRLRHPDYAADADALRRQNARAIEVITSGKPLPGAQPNLAAIAADTDITRSDRSAATGLNQEEENNEQFSAQDIANLLQT